MTGNSTAHYSGTPIGRAQSRVTTPSSVERTNWSCRSSCCGKINTGAFVPVFPVYVIDDDTARHEFVLSLDESVRFMTNPDLGPQRSYVEQLVRRRLHQAEFRGRVLQAYATQCAICNLRLGRLLEAAHIIGDAETEGDPVVPNGLSLCKIHHAAYDADLVGISPDFVVEINHELLETTDGPMLQYGLQAMNGRALTLPQRRVDRPDRERLGRPLSTVPRRQLTRRLVQRRSRADSTSSTTLSTATSTGSCSQIRTTAHPSSRSARVFR